MPLFNHPRGVLPTAGGAVPGALLFFLWRWAILAQMKNWNFAVFECQQFCNNSPKFQIHAALPQKCLIDAASSMPGHHANRKGPLYFNHTLCADFGDFCLFWSFSRLFWTISKSPVSKHPRDVRKRYRSGNRILRLNLPWKSLGSTSRRIKGSFQNFCKGSLKSCLFCNVLKQAGFHACSAKMLKRTFNASQ